MNNPETDNPETDNKAQQSSRRKLLALFAIAVGPILIAYALFFYVPAIVPEGTTNEGQLVMPPYRSDSLIAALPDRHWYIVHLADGTCEENCRQALHLTRQLHKALGKESLRVERVILTATSQVALSELLDSEYNSVTHIVDPAVADALRALKEEESGETLFVMDPNGNVMMWYREDQLGKPMLKDLKHLLRVSNIG